MCNKYHICMQTNCQSTIAIENNVIKDLFCFVLVLVRDLISLFLYSLQRLKMLRSGACTQPLLAL